MKFRKKPVVIDAAQRAANRDRKSRFRYCPDRGEATMGDQQELFLPERFDMLVRRAPDQLQSIVLPVESALDYFDQVFRDLRAAGRGGLWILRGDTGSGKSTFLHTISLFREGVETLAIPQGVDIATAMKKLKVTSRFAVVVIEGREALTDTSREELEKAVHAINTFVRTAAGSAVLFVWPCNTDALQELLTNIATSLGGESLLGGLANFAFSGPPPDDYYEIARRTVHTLNAGASISDLGVSEDQARGLARSAPTIGSYLNALRAELLKNDAAVSKLLGKERCRLWTIILASNDPEGDVAALTRGSLSTIDIERLLTATNANADAQRKRVAKVRKATIEERFRDFERDNPHVLPELLRLARVRLSQGATFISSKALWEEARVSLRAKGDVYKLNNDYTATVARRLIELEPRLDGVIRTRTRKTP